MVAKLAGGGLLKVKEVNTGRLYLVVLVLAIGCQGVGLGQDKPAVSSNGQGTGEVELDRQLQINKSTLLEGKSERIRIVAATEILLSKNPLARGILIDALKQTENADARVAVCKALSQSRASQEMVENRDDFVQPLLDVFKTGDSVLAGLAAEATLIFDYERVSEPLGKLIGDSSVPVKARLHGIYALELNPDMRAAVRLLELVDSPEKQVAGAAGQALESLGIPTGQDSQARQAIIEDLQSQGQEAFLRDQLIRRQSRMRAMRAALELWQSKYSLALDKIYVLSDDAARGKLLQERLLESRAVDRLWALEKVRELRVAPGPRKLPAELEPILINLISDQDRDVRLQTATLLGLMSELNSAERLLAQLEVEQDEEVKVKLFDALGGACYYATQPTSPHKIPIETRKKALEWACKYLAEQDSSRVQKGAQVMRRLLEQDGLGPGEADRYLALLAERYEAAKNGADGTLRGELLSAMAGLCAPRSDHNDISRKRFKPIFEGALSDKTGLVREAAVDGLIYIDKTGALKRLRKDFVNDPSPVVRKTLIELADDVGGKDDLGWLSERIGSNGESDLAWRAMLTIFNGSDVAVLNEWIDRFFSPGTTTKLSDQQRTAFLEAVEPRAAAENQPEMLKKVREHLAQLCVRTGRFERAEEYLRKLEESAPTANEKERVLSELMAVYLKWPKLDLAAGIVKKCLLERDLDPNDAVVRSIDDYLSNPPAGTDPNELLKSLRQIGNVPAGRPMWRQILNQWAVRLGKAAGPENLQGSGGGKEERAS